MDLRVDFPAVSNQKQVLYVKSFKVKHVQDAVKVVCCFELAMSKEAPIM